MAESKPSALADIRIITPRQRCPWHCKEMLAASRSALAASAVPEGGWSVHGLQHGDRCGKRIRLYVAPDGTIGPWERDAHER